MTKKKVMLEDLNEEFRKAAEGRPFEEVLALNDFFVAKAFSLGIFNDDTALDHLNDLIELVRKIHSLKC